MTDRYEAVWHTEMQSWVALDNVIDDIILYCHEADKVRCFDAVQLLNLAHSRSGADELRAIIENVIQNLAAPEKLVTAEQAVFKMNTAREILTAALVKHPSKSTAIEALDEMGQRK